MSNPSEHMFMSVIIEHAESGQFTEFHFLRDWSEYKFYKGKRRSFKLLVRALQDNSVRIFKNYCKNVTNGTADFTELLVYQKLQQITAFYEQETVILDNMIHEYENYLSAGNFIYAVLGASRNIEDEE